MAKFSKKTKIYGVISGVLFVATLYICLSNLSSYRDEWSPVLFGGIRVNSFLLFGAVVLSPFLFFTGHRFRKLAVKEMLEAGVSGYSRAWVYVYWFINSMLAFILFISPITTPSLLSSRLESDNTAAGTSIKAIQTACTTFNTMRCGLSDKLDDKYYGYPRQTQDLWDAEIETSSRREKIKGIDRALCAKEGKDGNSGGYYFRYTVLTKSWKHDGLVNITEYMISACPEEIGKSGSWVIISNTSGKMYKRVLGRVETREEMLITEWPSEEELAKKWEQRKD